MLILVLISQISSAQQSLYYQKAKESCLQAASKTKCPEKAAYFRKMADWNQCMLDQLAGKNVTCVEISGNVPPCEADQVGASKTSSTTTSNSPSKTNPVVDAMKTQEKISAANTLLDKNSSDASKNNAMDQIMGNPVGATNAFSNFLDILDGKQKKEKITSDLIISYKKLKYIFSTKYNLDYDQYISAIINGDYDKWKSLYKPEININTVLIHNLPSSYNHLYLGNIAVVSAYYGNFNFLQKLLTEFPNVGLNYESHRFDFCESLEIAIISGRIDIAKLLLDNGAVIFYKNGFKIVSYESWAKELGNFEIVALLKEYREKKDRKIGSYFEEKYIGWDDDNIEYLVKKLRNPDKTDMIWADKKYLLPKREPEITNTSTSASNKSLADEIKKLKDLLDAGTITKEEFDTAKKKLLEQN